MMYKCRLVGVTTPAIEDIPDAEGLLSFAARVSNPSNQNNFETAGKLLKYCLRNKHFSVFEMVNVVIEIECPRDIARQILRHRSFSFQEFSQRYAEARNFITREARLQDTKNRQNSLKGVTRDISEWWEDQQHKVLDVVREIYTEALEKGLAKEVARVILPEGLTVSRLYMNGTLRSWIHYCDLRDDEGVTQWEHVQVAKACKEVLVGEFPFLEEVWKEG